MMSRRCDAELCVYWTGDGCACDVFRIDPDEDLLRNLHASFYHSEQYKETPTERAARVPAEEPDEVCSCTPAWCFTRCPVCMGPSVGDDCPGGTS